MCCYSFSNKKQTSCPQKPVRDRNLHFFKVYRKVIFGQKKKRRWGKGKEASIQILVEALCLCQAEQLWRSLPSRDDLSPERDRPFRVQVWLLNYLFCFSVSQLQWGILGKICIHWIKWIGIFGIPQFTMCLPAIAAVLYFILLNCIS